MSKTLKNKDIVLLKIKENEPITNTQLAENLNMDLGNLGRYIKTLIKEGKINQEIEKKGKTRERVNTINNNGKKLTIIEKVDLSEKSIIHEKKKERKKLEVIQKPRAIPLNQLHLLTEENLIIFIKQTNKTKPYELKHRFYNNSVSEIHDLLDKLFQKGVLEKKNNGWIYLKNEKLKGSEQK